MPAEIGSANGLLFRGKPCKPGDPPGPYAEGFAKPLAGGGMENGIKEESQTMDACRRADAEEKSPKKTTPPLISKPLGFALPFSPCMGACGNGAGLFLHRMGRLEATANIYFCHPPKTIAATHLDAAGSE